MRSCAGGPRSRAGVKLQGGEAILRIAERTEIRFRPRRHQNWFLSLLKGFLYVFSRVPQNLEIDSPFLNGGIEGTEFLMAVAPGATRLTVFEGRVRARNAQGQLGVEGNQGVVARAGSAPQWELLVKPRDAVHWAIYYPPLLLEKSVPSPAPAVLEASRLLAAGCAGQAAQLLSEQPQTASVLALQAIIAILQDRRDEGLSLAQRALVEDPASTPARIALSYARQARFELEQALAAAQDAVAADPDNGLALGRRAELELAHGLVEAARQSAQRAERLLPQQGHAQTVRGFTALACMDAAAAQAAFQQALALQSEDPLSWFGLGLARIRQGRLAEGRADIETAVGHDPNNALFRSYLGKAYFEERRGPLDAKSLDTAKQLDPQDPTPWFYDALRRHSVNEPIQALQELRTSIAKNGNRGVYRSRFLLDQDLAVRGASLGRIYASLGFEQLAFGQGWRSLALDPGAAAAHRLLADAFAHRPRHEITRLSELLQAQLLQPLTTTPLQPQQMESGMQMLPDTGPSGGSNEYDPLFMRDGTRVSVNALAACRAFPANSQ